MRHSFCDYPSWHRASSLAFSDKGTGERVAVQMPIQTSIEFCTLEIFDGLELCEQPDGSKAYLRMQNIRGTARLRDRLYILDSDSCQVHEAESEVSIAFIPRDDVSFSVRSNIELSQLEVDEAFSIEAFSKGPSLMDGDVGVFIYEGGSQHFTFYLRREELGALVSMLCAGGENRSAKNSWHATLFMDVFRRTCADILADDFRQEMAISVTSGQALVRARLADITNRVVLALDGQTEGAEE